MYAIKNDPDQINNLAANPDYAEVKKELSEKLVKYLKETNDPRIEGKDPWQNYIYHQTSGFGSTYNKSLPNHKRERAKLRPSDHPTQKLNNK